MCIRDRLCRFSLVKPPYYFSIRQLEIYAGFHSWNLLIIFLYANWKIMQVFTCETCALFFYEPNPIGKLCRFSLVKPAYYLSISRIGKLCRFSLLKPAFFCISPIGKGQPSCHQFIRWVDRRGGPFPLEDMLAPLFPRFGCFLTDKTGKGDRKGVCGWHLLGGPLHSNRIRWHIVEVMWK